VQPSMDIENIQDENGLLFCFVFSVESKRFSICLDYRRCIEQAKTIQSEEKSLFCQNFYFVFYAELELNLNRYFSESSRECWSLLFVDYDFMPPVPLNSSLPIQMFYWNQNVLMIQHNAKVKYCCRDCSYEWTSARGRAIFQAEIPEENKHNVLFAYLFHQQCQKCFRDTEPCWYVDEATRVMKNISRILIEKFYSDRDFPFDDDFQTDLHQRESDMRHHHNRNLCSACQHRSCYD